MPLLSDAAVVIYPFLHFARESILSGQFPIWSSFMGGGRPFLAAFQSAVLSPFTVADYVLPFPWGLAVDTSLRLVAGGTGMSALLRRWHLAKGAAAFGGIAYLLNPFSVVWLEHPLSAVAAWLPWLLLAVDRCVGGADARGVAYVAMATAAALLSGHPETAFNAVLLAAAYAGVRSFQSPGAIKRMALVASGIVLGTAAVAIQVLPFLEYALESRALGTRGAAAAAPLITPPRAFASALVPDFYGHPLRHRFVLEGTNYAAQEAYPGVMVWLCAPLALAHRRLRTHALFALAAATIAYLIMYGTRVADVARWIVPPLRVAVPWSLACVPIAGLAIAAAIGLDAAFGAPARATLQRVRVSAAVVATGAALVTCVVLFLFSERDLLIATGQWSATLNAVGRGAVILLSGLVVLLLGVDLPRRAFALLSVAVLAADLFLFADGFHPLVPRAYAYPETPELQFIQRDRGLFRVAGWRLALPPNSLSVYGLQDFRSYDGVGLRRYEEFLEIGFRFNGTAFELVDLGTPQLLDLLNVKYIVAPADVDLPRDRFRLVYSGGSRVYENQRVQPRAFLADTFVVARGDDARRLLRRSVDLARTVVLDEHLGPEFRPVSATGRVGSVDVTHYEHTRIEIHTDSDARRLLVVSDAYYPGWRATIDGNPTPILLANCAFRAVSVPAGSHTIVMRYRPLSVYAGALISLVAWAVVAALRTKPATPATPATP
jgi:Bacterial membrane protein YfhO